MIKLTLFTCLLSLLISCSDRSVHYPQYKVTHIVSDSGMGKPFTIHRQFLSSAKCEKKINYASVYVCTAFVGTATSAEDSVYIVDPCENVPFHLGQVAVLFRPANISNGDTLIVEVPANIIKKIQNRNYLVGNLKMPEE
jgi:hypothetical protein